MVWTAAAREVDGNPAVRFSVTRPDGDQGYPGRLKASVSYQLDPEGRLDIRYEATADRPTPINFTHHSYFNLAGHAKGDVMGHELRLAASHYTPLDAHGVPAGTIAPVESTPYDFRTPRAIRAQRAAR